MRLKFIFIVALGLVLLSGFVMAQCPPDQLIVGLSADTNAHAELWDQGSYTTEICYSDIFGQNYTGASPHICTGTNKIIGLSADTNAHAESPDLVSYLADVCYGNLACVARASCQADEDAIVSLSASTNAHIELGSAGNYPVKICCKPGVVVSGAFWTNMVNGVISSADLNDMVKLNVQNGSGAIIFEIYREVPLGVDENVINIPSSDEFTYWKADTPGTYYFKVGDVQSGNLVVSSTQDNSPPILNLISPGEKEVHSTNSNVEFSFSASDVDDLIEVVLDFGDGSSQTIENETSYSLNHTYLASGQKNIRATLFDGRGLWDSDFRRILIYNPSSTKTEIFASITNPDYLEIVSSLVVGFDATSSFAINVSPSGINCIAGNCPSQTDDGQTIQNSPQGIDSLNFNWDFGDGSSLDGIGTDGASFNKPYSLENSYTVLINVSLTSLSSNTETYFIIQVAGDTPYCFVDSGETFWIEQGIISPSIDDCHRANGRPTEFCCPVGRECEENGQWSCTGYGVDSCSGYGTESDCLNYNPATAENDVNAKISPKFCGYSEALDSSGETCYSGIGNCGCVWNSSTNVCGSSYSETEWCEGTGFTDLGSCTLSVVSEGNCSGGFKRVIWDALWSGDEENRPLYCMGDEKTVKCISGAMLSVYTWVSLIISILLIFIYVFLKVYRIN